MNLKLSGKRKKFAVFHVFKFDCCILYKQYFWVTVMNTDEFQPVQNIHPLRHRERSP